MGRGLKPMDVDVYFDPPTHHLYGNRLFDRESNPYAGDNILAPYAAVYDRLRSYGIKVQTADFLPATSVRRRALLISFGTPDRLVAQSVKKYRALALRSDVTLSAFFAMECPIVEPTMYRALPRLEQCFQRIFSWSDSSSLLKFTAKPVRLEHFCWPQSFDAVHEHLWSNQERKFLTMINANKLPRLYVDELYTARLRAVEFFERYGEIDLYGRNWDRMPTRVGKVRTPVILRRGQAAVWEFAQRLRRNPLYAAAARATRGPALSKSATLAQYRFALCFENSILKGWITEKLFDCFFAGTVPVYWGAPDVLDWVPADCFIDMRQFRDFAELRAFLHALPQARLQRYREAARAYLASDQFKPFRLEAFAELIAGIVAADAGIAS
jgi:alpha(1,3/1,4) fucosyltransferase